MHKPVFFFFFLAAIAQSLSGHNLLPPKQQLVKGGTNGSNHMLFRLFEVNAFAPKTAKHPKHTTTSARSQVRRETQTVKNQDEVCLGYGRNIIFSNQQQSTFQKTLLIQHRYISRGQDCRKTTRRIPFLKILAITSNKKALGMFLRL